MGVQGPRERLLDLANDSVFHELVGLALRRVVREWHAGPPCLTFGTLRRPRLRSKLCPAGFDPSDELTALRNRLARRVAFIFSIALRTGLFFSVEPGPSVMFRRVTRLCMRSLGAAFTKPANGSATNPGCLTCPKGALAQPTNHAWRLRIPSPKPPFVPSTLVASLQQLYTVFGAAPVPGQSVASYSARCPIALMQRMASGSLAGSGGTTLPERQLPLLQNFLLTAPFP